MTFSLGQVKPNQTNYIQFGLETKLNQIHLIWTHSKVNLVNIAGYRRTRGVPQSIAEHKHR